MVLKPAQTRAEVGREWWFRAWAERDSTARFARLHNRLVQATSPPQLIDACRDAIEDERRHALLCAQTAATFVTVDPFERRPCPGEPLGPAHLTPQERLLFEMVAFCCVTESLNAALLLSILDVAVEPTVRTATQALLKDEVQHAKLGWAFLAHHRQRLGAPHFLAAFIPRMLRAAASENLTESDTFCATWSDPDVGYLSREQRLAVFHACIQSVILPGLEVHDIDTSEAHDWVRSQVWTAPIRS